MSIRPGVFGPRGHGRTERTKNFAEVCRAVRHGLRDVPPGGLILAAVSGGADSLALAAALAREAPRAELRIAAVTVDHGLQDGSDRRAACVSETCESLGFDPVVVERVTVGRAGGPEAAARDARYRAIDEVTARLDAGAVMLAHTLDDQAETVLLGLARGSGARSLSGMPASRGRLRRPLLQVRRATTRAACAELGLEVWDDPHNVHPAFARARVRADLLPALEATLGPGVAEALVRSAAMLRDDADALDALAVEAIGRPDALEVAVLAGQPAAVRTRMIRLALIAAGSPVNDLTASHVQRIDALVTDWHGQGAVKLPGGLEASRECGRLLIR